MLAFAIVCTQYIRTGRSVHGPRHGWSTMGPPIEHNARFQRERRGREWHLYAVYDRDEWDRFSLWGLIEVRRHVL